MKTLSTKLDKKDHERFIDLCLAKNQTPSESIRNLIQDYCNSMKIIDYEYEPILQKEPQNPAKSLDSERQRIFDCMYGILYEDGKRLGKCSDYVIKNGLVYDNENNLLGKTLGLVQKQTT